MTRLTTREVARGFADTLNRVAYGRERLVITRRGRPLAAIVPVADLREFDARTEKRG